MAIVRKIIKKQKEGNIISSTSSNLVHQLHQKPPQSLINVSSSNFHEREEKVMVKSPIIQQKEILSRVIDPISHTQGKPYFLEGEQILKYLIEISRSTSQARSGIPNQMSFVQNQQVYNTSSQIVSHHQPCQNQMLNQNKNENMNGKRYQKPLNEMILIEDEDIDTTQIYRKKLRVESNQGEEPAYQVANAKQQKKKKNRESKGLNDFSWDQVKYPNQIELENRLSAQVQFKPFQFSQNDIDSWNRISQNVQTKNKSVISIASDSETSVDCIRGRNENQVMKRATIQNNRGHEDTTQDRFEIKNKKMEQKMKQHQQQQVQQQQQYETNQLIQIQERSTGGKTNAAVVKPQKNHKGSGDALIKVYSEMKDKYKLKVEELKKSLLSMKGIVDDRMTFDEFVANEQNSNMSGEKLNFLKEVEFDSRFAQYRISRIHICAQIGRGGVFSTKRVLQEMIQQGQQQKQAFMEIGHSNQEHQKSSEVMNSRVVRTSEKVNSNPVVIRSENQLESNNQKRIVFIRKQVVPLLKSDNEKDITIRNAAIDEREQVNEIKRTRLVIRKSKQGDCVGEKFQNVSQRDVEKSKNTPIRTTSPIVVSQKSMNMNFKIVKKK